jgi:hypothetical protein
MKSHCVLKVIPEEYNHVLVCTALVIWMYYAIRQELAVWYILQVSARYIAQTVGLQEVSAFLQHFFKIMYIHYL